METPRIIGRVTRAQKGQQGPAMTKGVPSRYETSANMFPIRRAQQQKYEWTSLGARPSATCRSHCVETAYLHLFEETVNEIKKRR